VAKTDKLSREIAHLRGLTDDAPEIRPLFHVFNDDGKVLGYETLSGDWVKEPGQDDVVFTITRRMLDLLNSGSRFIIAEGGRGGGKSVSIGSYLIARAIAKQERILCIREIQISIRYSVKAELEALIDERPKLGHFFDVQRDAIIGHNGSEFLFKGMRDHSADSVRSFAGVSLAWVEEGQTITRRSWDVLTPTIRKPRSQILVSMNRRHESDPIYRDFVADSHPLASVGRFLLWQNPWTTAENLAEAEALRRTNFERWSHVWDGQIETLSDIRILDNWSIEDFDIEKILKERIKLVRVGVHGYREEREARYRKAVAKIEKDFHIGVDFGFRDPTAGNR